MRQSYTLNRKVPADFVGSTATHTYPARDKSGWVGTCGGHTTERTSKGSTVWVVPTRVNRV